MHFLIVDWDDRFHTFASEETFFGDTSIELLPLGRVVISDRLVGAILAQTSGLPFIFLDQSSHSPGHDCSVALDGPNYGDRELGILSLATTLQHAIGRAASMLNMLCNYMTKARTHV